MRYSGRPDYIDLTPYLGDGSSVVTSKSVRDPAGAWSVSFADRPNSSGVAAGPVLPTAMLETVYGLVEPMDVVEIRMWGGVGQKPATLPIKMRGFVSKIDRSQAMGNDGRPIRTVVISGQDYGKIWQTYQILYLQAYAAGKALLTTYSLWELFGMHAENTLPAGDFIRRAVTSILNPHIAGLMPEKSLMPKELKLDISVSRGVVNNSYQSQEGSVYEMLRLFGDVGVWNELYTEDREDGVYVVYRPRPALSITKKKDAKNRKIMTDAPDPVFVTVADEDIQSLVTSRSDANVANFYWVSNQRYDMIDDIYRKLLAIKDSDTTVNLKDYPNAATKYYGVRPMMASTEQGDDGVTNLTSGLNATKQAERGPKLEAWIDYRRRTMVELNKDNVVLETGQARIKGGLMRADGSGCFRAGDYARIRQGNLEFEAYVASMTDEFIPFRSYTTTLQLERGTGFATRAQLEGGTASPWLAEQATATNYPFGKVE